MAPHRILLIVTGLAPQVVTETLYALAVVQEPRWVPDEIHLITTGRGAQKAREALVGEGWLDRLCQDYALPATALHFHVVAGSGGEPLEDILAEAHNGLVADFITGHVRGLTAEPDTCLHVSIAGGRKTMGFYAGYALSLFGRAQDRLSHVLVSPPFESLEDFYYPSPVTRVLQGRDGQMLDARDARVHLGEIPFVRLRGHLPERLLSGTATFSEAVAEAQKAIEPLPPLSLELLPATRRVVAAGRGCELDAALFALYWMLADRCREGRGGVRRDEPELGVELLRYYGRLQAPASALYARTEEAYARFDASNFDQAKAKLNRALGDALGMPLAGQYRVHRLESVPGTRIHRFGLSVPPEVIRIDLASLRDA